MPFGDFLEIEGERSDIRSAAADIGLDWPRRILGNYLEIFEFLRNEMGWAFSDLTFDNFNEIELDPVAVMDRIAGRFVPGPAGEAR